MSRLTDSLRTALLGIDGVQESDSMFSDDMAFWVNGKEIAHFQGEDALELRLTKPLIRELRHELRQDGRVVMRASSSDWIIVAFECYSDVEFIVNLASRAVARHLPAPGEPIKAPPTGAALARRRRFH